MIKLLMRLRPGENWEKNRGSTIQQRGVQPAEESLPAGRKERIASGEPWLGMQSCANPERNLSLKKE